MAEGVYLSTAVFSFSVYKRQRHVLSRQMALAARFIAFHSVQRDVCCAVWQRRGGGRVTVVGTVLRDGVSRYLIYFAAATA
jgi:hypothetical protein